MVAIAIFLFWVLAAYGFFSKKPHVLIYILFGTMPLGSFAVIPTVITGGLTFTATPIVALLIIARVFTARGGLNLFTNIALSKKHGLFLFAFWVVGIFTTIFMPRLFSGDVMVVPLRGISLAYAFPLAPSSQNFSQLIYVSISILSVFAFIEMFREEKMRQHAIAAMCLGATVQVVSGFLDFLNYYLPLDFILETFRNASYALAVDVEIFSSKRVVGLMPEASAFGNMCVNFLAFIYFFRRACEDAFLREKAIPVLIVALILLVWLSTSSASYVGLGFLGAMIGFEWMWRALKDKRNRLLKQGLMVELWLLNIALICFLTTVLVYPELFDPIIERVDRMVFQKTESYSYIERSMWNATAWQALLDTYGIGVGLGSARTSNGVVALVSSFGIVGTLFYVLFLLQVFLRHTTRDDHYGEAFISACKWSFLPPFLVDTLIATAADFGVSNAFRFGLVLSITYAMYSKNKYANPYN